MLGVITLSGDINIMRGFLSVNMPLLHRVYPFEFLFVIGLYLGEGASYMGHKYVWGG